MNAGVHSLFVYGSLRSGFKSPAYEYISRFFSFVGNAKVKGKLFDLGLYPGGISTTEDSYIIGELYTIKLESEFAWAIGQLDDYEGIAVEFDEIPLYKRELVDVFINNNPATFAWIYWYSGNVEGKPLIESGDMIQYLREKNNTSATFP
ncbi:MAG: gamma-glutamylcyclotransferase [Chitinophagales bacterium]